MTNNWYIWMHNFSTVPDLLLLNVLAVNSKSRILVLLEIKFGYMYRRIKCKKKFYALGVSVPV